MQEEIFLKTEGDKYFKRNLVTIKNRQWPEIYAMCTKYIKKNFKVLEIGCCIGENLNNFSKFTECICYGIDPSEMAVEYGKNNYHDIDLRLGTADDIDFPDEFFDFVLLGYCLPYVDRKLLSKVVSETDRILKNKGFLSIVTAETKIPVKRKYKHNSNVMFYKMDYSSLFSVYPHYQLIDKKSNIDVNTIKNIQEVNTNTIFIKDYENAYIFV